MKKASTKGGSGLPKASILNAPAAKGAAKLPKIGAKKTSIKMLKVGKKK